MRGEVRVDDDRRMLGRRAGETVSHAQRVKRRRAASGGSSWLRDCWRSTTSSPTAVCVCGVGVKGRTRAGEGQGAPAALLPLVEVGPSTWLG